MVAAVRAGRDAGYVHPQAWSLIARANAELEKGVVIDGVKQRC